MNTKQVSTLSGVSVRTLHHYDEIGLLSPRRNPHNRYREYSQENIDQLQQILFFRECGFSLSEIKKFIHHPDYNKEDAFRLQQSILKREKQRIDSMLSLLKESLGALQGENTLSNENKFSAFKEHLIQENEKKYGKEIRAKHGNTTIDNYNKELLEMNQETYDNAENLDHMIIQLLEEALDQTSPQLLKQIATHHKEWLQIMWGKSVNYTKEVHLNLIEMYLVDPRFSQHYGGTKAVEILKTAVKVQL